MHEALLFSAQLRLIDVSKDKIRRFVDEVGPPFLPCDPAALESRTWRYPSDSEYSVFRSYLEKGALQMADWAAMWSAFAYAEPCLYGTEKDS